MSTVTDEERVLRTGVWTTWGATVQTEQCNAFVGSREAAEAIAKAHNEAIASLHDGVYAEIRAERERAHAKHGDTSMEAQPVDDLMRLSILAEEVGEISREFNDARHDGRAVDLAALRSELIQTAAMAAAWADRIGVTT